ncbi:MAG: rod-binding protein [Halieaceae bacterium]|nr:rod-binding protein [Halieaceae bacterium]
MAIENNTAFTPMDFAGMADLRVEARSGDEQGALKEAAQQFESLFVQMMLKSMRDAVPDGGLLGSHSMDTYQEMHDKQIALDISRRGGLGLANMIEAQLQARSVDISNTDKT